MPPLHLSQNTYKNLDTRRQSLEHKLLHPVANELLKYRMMELPGVSGLPLFPSSILGGDFNKTFGQNMWVTTPFSYNLVNDTSHTFCYSLMHHWDFKMSLVED